MAIQMMPSSAQALTGPRGSSKHSDDTDNGNTTGAEAFAGMLAAAQQPQQQTTPNDTGSAGTQNAEDDKTVSAATGPQGKGLTGAATNGLEQAASGLDHSQSPVARLAQATAAAADAAHATAGQANGAASEAAKTEAARSDAAKADAAKTDAANSDQAATANSKLFDALGQSVPELVGELEPGQVGKEVSATARAHAAEVHADGGQGKAKGIARDAANATASASGASAATSTTSAQAATAGTSGQSLGDLLAASGATVTSTSTSGAAQAGSAATAGAAAQAAGAGTDTKLTDVDFDRVLGTVTKSDAQGAKSHASATGASSTEAAANGAHKSSDGSVTVAPVGVPSAPQAAASSSIGAPEVVKTDPTLGLHEQLSEPVLAVRTRGNGTHTITVEVHPNDLGPVQVQVRVDGTSTSVTVTGTHDAHDVLRAAMPALHAELRAAGLHDLEVNLGSATPNPQQDGSSRNPFAGMDDGFGANGSGGHANHEARGQQPGAHPDGTGSPVRNDVNRPTRTRASGVDRLL